MNMVHCKSLRKTQTSAAGEQLVKGYRSQAHQTMRGRGVLLASRPNSSDDRPAMPKKTQKSHAQTCVQKTGPGTVTSLVQT